MDLVIHSGDVFDSVRPATHVIIGFLKQTARITARAGIPYLVAAGNHETPRLRTTTAALEYANLVNAISAHGFDLDYELIEVGDVGVGVTLVPHGAVFGTGAVTPSRGADVNVLVTHGMVPGLEARQHEMGEANLQAGMIEGGFDYVASVTTTSSTNTSRTPSTPERRNASGSGRWSRSRDLPSSNSTTAGSGAWGT